ncbi:MAG TPA: iron uptake porin [Allocoleopsis sp.]
MQSRGLWQFRSIGSAILWVAIVTLSSELAIAGEVQPSKNGNTLPEAIASQSVGSDATETGGRGDGVTGRQGDGETPGMWQPPSSSQSQPTMDNYTLASGVFGDSSKANVLEQNVLEQIDRYSNSSQNITSISELETVSPSDVAARENSVLEQSHPDSNSISDRSVPQITDSSGAGDVAQQGSVATPANRLEQIDQYSNDFGGNSLDQVTNVSQLRDVSPNDWAFEALRNLVERYGCIAGYPDGTYRGNRAMTRYEFAAGLNSCLQQIERLITTSTTGFVRREDLETLQRLVQEFQTELTALGARVDKLEGRTAFLEDASFSTTTKLDGEIVVGLTGIISGDDIFSQKVDNVEIFGGRTRLNFETSFTGRDLLRTRLQAFGLRTYTSRTQTYEGNLAFADENADNDIKLDALIYSFPLSESTQVVVAANGGRAYDFASTVNFLDGDGASGALTRFGTRNPIYYLVEGSGVGIRQQLGNAVELSLGYLAGDAGNPGEDGGVFNGPYGAMAQLLFKPSRRFQVALTYINSYNRETLTGSPLSNPRSFLRTLSNQPVNLNFQPPTLPPTPIVFPANQPIPVGTTIPSGTALPAGTRINDSLTFPFPITIGVITIPAGTTVPAGTRLPRPVTLPIDLTLPASITLPTDLTLPGATTPPRPPIVFNGTVGDLLSQPDFAGIPLGFNLDIPIISHSYGLEFSWQASDRFVLGGWVGYTVSSNLTTGNGLFSRGNINTINGAMTLAFPDLGKKGNLAGIIVGVEPFVLTSDIQVNDNFVDVSTLDPSLIPAGLALLDSIPFLKGITNIFKNPDPDVSVHVEAFYQMRLTDNISLTPGIVWITAPGSLANNADLVIGTLRATLTF